MGVKGGGDRGKGEKEIEQRTEVSRKNMEIKKKNTPERKA